MDQGTKPELSSAEEAVKATPILTTAGLVTPVKEHIETLGQNIGEQLLKDLLGDATGYLIGTGWNTKEALPTGLFKFTVKNPTGVVFDCEIGYQDGNFVFNGTPQSA